jgi:cell shape-determining protein MreD
MVMLLTLGFGILVQVLAPSVVSMGNIKPPVILGVVVYYALTRSPPLMVAAALLGGLLVDALSPVPLGYSSFCFLVIGAVLSTFRSLVISDALVTPLFFGAVAAPVSVLMGYLLLVQDGSVVWGAGPLFAKMGGSLLLGAVTVMLVFVAVRPMERWVGTRSEEELLDELA